jgi:hypothetical protein
MIQYWAKNKYFTWGAGGVETMVACIPQDVCISLTLLQGLPRLLGVAPVISPIILVDLALAQAALVDCSGQWTIGLREDGVLWRERCKIAPAPH